MESEQGDTYQGIYIPVIYIYINIYTIYIYITLYYNDYDRDSTHCEDSYHGMDDHTSYSTCFEYVALQEIQHNRV